MKRPWPGLMRGVYGDPDRFRDTYFVQFPGVYFTGDGAMHRITFGPNGDVDIDRLEGNGRPIGFNENGRQLYVSQGGELRVVTIPGGQSKTVSTSVEFVEDFDATKVAAFEQGWGEMRDGFYNTDYHGANWPGVRDRFRRTIRSPRRS